MTQIIHGVLFVGILSFCAYIVNKFELSEYNLYSGTKFDDELQ